MKHHKHPIAIYRKSQAMTLETFGAMVGVQKAAVYKWEHGQPPSTDSAKAIDKATDGMVPKHILRPDVWTPPKRGAGA